MSVGTLHSMPRSSHMIAVRPSNVHEDGPPRHARCNSSDRGMARASFFLVAVGALSGTPGILVRIEGPAPVAYERTALGHATHHVAVTVTNSGMRALEVPRAPLTYVATRDGLAFPC